MLHCNINFSACRRAGIPEGRARLSRQLEKRCTSHLIDGVIRKLWIDRAGPYRDHLLRLDAESRRNRFGGAVSDEFIANYAELSRSGSTP